MSRHQYFEANPQWYAIPLKSLERVHTNASTSDVIVKKRLEEGQKLLQEENACFEATPGLLPSDRAFYSAMLKSGTLRDKTSTLSVLASASPIHALKVLDTLMGMAKKNNRHESLHTIISLRDVMTESLLPPRKLKDQPLAGSDITAQHLILWAFEDYLKKYYFELIQLIEARSHDALSHIRQQMIETIFMLVKSKPEQEQNLLKLLVNKLGDNDKKVASKTSYLVQQLSITKPSLKLAIVREIEQFILLSHSKDHVHYYGVITLNQTILRKKDVDVANKLIDIYFMLFRKTLGVKTIKKNKIKSTDEIRNQTKKRKSPGQIQIVNDESGDSKMIAAILTGVNRAFPFAKVEEEVYKENLDILFRITYFGTFNTSVQALMLIFQVCSVKETISDRFYRTLYESLLDNRLITTSKHAMYLNLLFKALKADESLARVKAFVKRILQIATHHQPPFICGVFHLLSELFNGKPGLRALIFQPEDHDDEEHFFDVPDDEIAQTPVKTEMNLQPFKNDCRTYDRRKRDPQYSNADQTCLWELCSFSKHFHPSVALYANQLLQGISIESQPELHFHTLSHFLDRFVYRNPKKTDSTRGSSLMQPPMVPENGFLTLKKGAGITKEEFTNTEEFWRKKIEDVPVDQIFFHKYFNQKHVGQASNLKKTKKKQNGAHNEQSMSSDDDDNDMEEEEIWRVMSQDFPNVDFNPEDLQDDLELHDYSDDEDENYDGLDSEDNSESCFDEDESIRKKVVTSQTKHQNKVSKKGSDKSLQKRKLVHLPTFASFEDYAAMLD